MKRPALAEDPSSIRPRNGAAARPLFRSPGVDRLRPGSSRAKEDEGRLTAVGTHASRIATLSRREREVIALLAGEGLSNREISERLFISVRTVRHHLSTVLGKLGLVDRCKLIVYAYSKGLAQPRPSAFS